ncbi:MAG: hypothetical protein IIC75_00340 [Bacteroidetes bacterium]|nr:hypothetical protein [Bacteroidota bacterium]
MKPEDFKLICIQDEGHKGWSVFPEKEPFRFLMVQVDKLEDAPKKLAKLFEVMFEIAFKKGLYTKKTFKPEEK